MTDKDVQFGTPSPIKSTLHPNNTIIAPSLKPPKDTFAPKPNQHIPFRTGYAPHNSLHRPIPQEKNAPSPSSYPHVKFESKQWKKDGLALPSFKKKPSDQRQPATAIRVPREGERPGYVEPPRIKPPHRTTYIDEERYEPSDDPSKAAEQFKSFLDVSFTGDDEDTSLQTDVVAGLQCRLLPHQIAGLKFLQSRESKTKTGGLLADDMGLGKTVQTLALVVSRPRPQELKCIKSTLVVAPLSLIEQWAGEVKSKTKLSVYIHHGPARLKNARQFSSYDIVMTTYQILASEHTSDIIDDEVYDHRGVFGVTWWRVVLDEAHTIKNRSAKMSIAACSLRSVKRWTLTGTPIQNNVDELFSLLKFLRVHPLCEYPIFKEKISGPITRGKTKLAMKRLSAILSTLMLRRMKSILAVKLPDRKVHHVKVQFSPLEREFYAGLESRADKVLKQMQRDGEVGYMSVLVLLQRLRQACNHMELVTKQVQVAEYSVEDLPQDKEVDDLADLFSGLSPVKSLPMKAVESVALPGTLARSAKIESLMTILRGEDRKTIIFSQWTSMLDIIEPFLKSSKISYVKYYGSMTHSLREQSIREFKAGVEVMLCSLKAGALGLNLTAASRVVMVDVWWNPAVEDQAVARVHRIGQTRDVVVYRLTVADTVEDRILELQERKRELANAALDGGEVMKLGLNELLALFRE